MLERLIAKPLIRQNKRYYNKRRRSWRGSDNAE